MGVFTRKSRWQKAGEAIKPRIPDSAIRAGRTLVGTAASAVGITLASAAISAARQRKEDQ